MSEVGSVSGGVSGGGAGPEAAATTEAPQGKPLESGGFGDGRTAVSGLSASAGGGLNEASTNAARGAESGGAPAGTHDGAPAPEGSSGSETTEHGSSAREGVGTDGAGAREGQTVQLGDAPNVSSGATGMVQSSCNESATEACLPGAASEGGVATQPESMEPPAVLGDGGAAADGDTAQLETGGTPAEGGAAPLETGGTAAETGGLSENGATPEGGAAQPPQPLPPHEPPKPPKPRVAPSAAPTGDFLPRAGGPRLADGKFDHPPPLEGGPPPTRAPSGGSERKNESAQADGGEPPMPPAPAPAPAWNARAAPRSSAPAPGGAPGRGRQKRRKLKRPRYWTKDPVEETVRGNVSSSARYLPRAGGRRLSDRKAPMRSLESWEQDFERMRSRTSTGWNRQVIDRYRARQFEQKRTMGSSTRSRW